MNDIAYIEEWQRQNKDKMRVYRLRWHFNNRKKQLVKMREYSKLYRLRRKALTTMRFEGHENNKAI